jgi:hypothetical protein
MKMRRGARYTDFLHRSQHHRLCRRSPDPGGRRSSGTRHLDRVATATQRARPGDRAKQTRLSPWRRQSRWGRDVSTTC